MDSIIIKDNSAGHASKESSRNAISSADRPRRKADPYILGIYLFFILVSLIEIFSASSTEVRADNIYGPLKRHAIFLLLGMVIVYALQRLNYLYLRRFAVILGVGSLLLLMYASFFGANINGAQRAINIGGFTIQPAEIVKYTVVLLLAKILGDNQLSGGVKTGGVIKVAVVVLIFSGVLWMNGLTNMILLMGVSLAMFLIGNIEFKKLVVVIIAYGVCAGLLLAWKYKGSSHSEFDQVVSEMTDEGADAASGRYRVDTHLHRITSFTKGVSPTDTITDENRQVWFATMAQAHGGVFGRGPGNSRESARLPLAFSDYIYSIVVEDSGLVGGLVLLVLYLALVFRAGVITFRLRKAFPAFLIMGCAVMIVFQALVHMAIVVGIVPVSGQPLPFISKGGTSILVMSAAIGTMLSVSRFAAYRSEDIEKRKQQTDEEEVDAAAID
ncbi:MAG: FtsW/RodA/SpoVE family cell cycle protein [Muribaculaceae bacterium]|nr:FtsW/RodA/SpoVE family cell cycle protein [Muribaculaceae bacterium]